MCGRIEHQHAARRTFGERHLGNQFRRQFVSEVLAAHARMLHGGFRGAPAPIVPAARFSGLVAAPLDDDRVRLDFRPVSRQAAAHHAPRGHGGLHVQRLVLADDAQVEFFAWLIGGEDAGGVRAR
jgi:hypothetical protein